MGRNGSALVQKSQAGNWMKGGGALVQPGGIDIGRLEWDYGYKSYYSSFLAYLVIFRLPAVEERSPPQAASASMKKEDTTLSLSYFMTRIKNCLYGVSWGLCAKIIKRYNKCFNRPVSIFNSNRAETKSIKRGRAGNGEVSLSWRETHQWIVRVIHNENKEGVEDGYDGLWRGWGGRSVGSRRLGLRRRRPAGGARRRDLGGRAG